MSLALITSSVDQLSLVRYLEEIKKIPSLEAEEEKELARRMIEERDIKAAQTLVTSHLKLVAKIAFKYKGYGLPLIEMMAEGNIGLMQAVKKFNPELGFRLSTYATWWIKAAIQEYILKSWSLVKIGTTVAQKKLFFNLKKLKLQIAKSEMSNKSLSQLEIKQIAKVLDVEENDIKEMDLRMNGSDVSLNNLVGEEGAEVIDFIPDNKANQEQMAVVRQEKDYRRKLFYKAINVLDDRERSIINDRYLIEQPLTLEQISKKLGVSTERVRQIEARAIEKLKANVGAA